MKMTVSRIAVGGTATWVAVVALAELAFYKLLGDMEWAQTVRDLGFPIFTAIALGLAIRWVGKKLLSYFERLIDAIIADNRIRTESNKKSNTRLTILAKKMGKLIELQMEHGNKLSEIATRISHQTNAIRSEARHVEDVIKKPDTTQ